MGKLFGTDGIRGVANVEPMTSEMALNVGRAVTSLFLGNRDRAGIVIGKDTRISGPMLEHALASGVCAMGGDVFLAGVLPTPGIAYVTTLIRANAGVVISASHNPYYDNGIKIFQHSGYKLPDEKEDEIESLLSGDQLAAMNRSVRDTGRVLDLPDAAEKYVDFLIGSMPEKEALKGLRIVLDCSNGATYEVAPALFSRLGASVTTLFDQPDGKNINDGCGSQHPEKLIETVKQTGAAIGLAFDGDGDRLIAVDEKGERVTGDQILVICAGHLKREGRLRNNLVVSTVMSNIGFRLALKEMAIDHIITDVGDRYVLKEMVEKGSVIGGEDSGHMIFLDDHTTGDGILTALRLIEAMMAASKPLSELRSIMSVFPQILLNVEVREKPAIENMPRVMAAIQAVEDRLGEKGRVLVRYSGTQPLCRVMVEGPTEAETRQYCQEIIDVVQKEIGLP